ncbi:hypothetical protein ThrDRAFT_00473 [Frankia casuarinae]|jgi:hypothetical protein|nr:hypothetical protein CcI6DRAFT_04004 [Frankia sp. CcI6]EYT93723.1 hypothetical protein ThrDRAFT_00473 [Frankia casuarinae]KFB06365.1 hypothetical protein ALLO2DRAFT_00893 [Frankia sp. Allo2]OAA20387.1 hypothetical protein AAY23_10952 [Frankia casuarinae]
MGVANRVCTATLYEDTPDHRSNPPRSLLSVGLNSRSPSRRHRGTSIRDGHRCLHFAATTLHRKQEVDGGDGQRWAHDLLRRASFDASPLGQRDRAAEPGGSQARRNNASSIRLESDTSPRSTVGHTAPRAPDTNRQIARHAELPVVDGFRLAGCTSPCLGQDGTSQSDHFRQTSRDPRSQILPEGPGQPSREDPVRDPPGREPGRHPRSRITSEYCHYVRKAQYAPSRRRTANTVRQRM